MSAAEAVSAARSAGIKLDVDGDDLVLEAAAPPAPAILERLSRHKAAIIAWIRPGADGWSAEDWQAFFDERSGIAEFDGELPLYQSEAQAFSCCVTEWLNRNPVSSPMRQCLGCGDRDHDHDPLLPFGLASTGHAWLHSRCWPAWAESRKAEAVAAVKAMGVVAPDDSALNSGREGRT